MQLLVSHNHRGQAVYTCEGLAEAFLPHAGEVKTSTRGGWVGVLIEGPDGNGCDRRVPHYGNLLLPPENSRA